MQRFMKSLRIEGYKQFCLLLKTFIRMLRISFPLLFSALFLFSFGCEKDNFLTTEETPDELSPTVVETEENFISYRMPSGAVITQVGTGLINTDEGLVALATSGTAIAECLEGGTFSLRTEGAGLVLGFSTDPVEPFFVLAFDVEGAPDASVFRNPVCESTPAVLNLTTLTDSQAAGTLTVEFFTLNPGAPGSTDCEDAISLGIFEIDFNVALEPCN